jgi:hypothetical protein
VASETSFTACWMVDWNIFCAKKHETWWLPEGDELWEGLRYSVRYGNERSYSSSDGIKRCPLFALSAFSASSFSRTFASSN